MNTISSVKKVLVIDLARQESEVKSYSDLGMYIGGVGLGLKLLSIYDETDPVIFSVGPLNGFFPFVSKTSVVARTGGVLEDVYLGGSLSFRIKFAGLDSILIHGRSNKPVVLDIINDNVTFLSEEIDFDSLGLPGKRSTLSFSDRKETTFTLAQKKIPKDAKAKLDGYFMGPENILEEKLREKNIYSLVVTGTKTFEIQHKEKYEELFKKILERITELSVESSTHPSCSGCPMGCSKSQVGEIGGNLLVHSLTACSFAESIYSDVGTVFSCLNVLGYDYTHEDIENLSVYVGQVLKDLDD